MLWTWKAPILSHSIFSTITPNNTFHIFFFPLFESCTLKWFSNEILFCEKISSTFGLMHLLVESSSWIFNHFSGDLKCCNKWPQLNFFAGSAKKSLFKFCKLDQEVNFDFLRQLQSVEEQMDLCHNILKFNNVGISKIQCL